MKQTTNNSKNTINKNANQKHAMKSKKTEANTPRHRTASAKEVCDTITKMIEIEVLDGILLNLSVKSQVKPMSVQNRILRRIVEKRQAQANHKKHGRTEDLTSIRISIASTSRCMEVIRKKRFAA